MDPEILETFPRVDKVQPAIAQKFHHMIRCYLQSKKKTPTLKQFGVYKHVKEVYDDEGKLVCFFKVSRDAKKEAAVYILDHPLSEHRSVSSEIIGFGGATPTVFIRTEETSGCLVWFVENNGVIGAYDVAQFNTLPREISKLSIFHLRFGSADCHDRNTVTKMDAQKLHHLTPIDHEECFTRDYHIRRIWWKKRNEAKNPYTEEEVGYVNRLDVERDLEFLKNCGWEVPDTISVPYRIFTFFLKTAVQFKLTPLQMVEIARNVHSSPNFKLENMVGDKTKQDELFVRESHQKIESALRQYSRRFL